MGQMRQPRAEDRRLAQDARRAKNWKRWGPYLAERQWGTVREDYSPDGTCWDYFPRDHAPSRAYRWGEDGLLGITDRQCRLCFALALWNGRDPLLKERLFGLTNEEGNHGEDVKEHYFYLDSTPTHSYLKALYKYPQAEFPYRQLLDENRRRGKDEPEFEVEETGVFDDGRYFDVVAEYAKGGPNDILIRITVANRGPEAASLHLLPTLWFRNTWIWGCGHEGCTLKPRIELGADGLLHTTHETLQPFRFAIGPGPDGEAPPILFTENETNTRKLFGVDQYTPYVKDAFHEYVVRGRTDAVSPKPRGTKAAAHYVLELGPGEEATVRLRLFAKSLFQNEPWEGEAPAEPPSALRGRPCRAPLVRGSAGASPSHHVSSAPHSGTGSKDGAPREPLGPGFDGIVEDRIAEADAFYADRIPEGLGDEERRVMRQGYAGLLWTKQFYHYVVDDWLTGDAEQPPPPPERLRGRNADWPHVYSRDVISMPDKWEYPWFAAWDLAFHMIPFARIDPAFAKKQLLLFLREWYMHPNGQIPAYEFCFSDVNPPVHAWACWRVYKMTAPRGERDREFLARAFQKLLMNFTWWVNRKDEAGRHVFSGGFLGLDNIGVFDRSKPLPTGGRLDQADGTAWMAFYCATMLAMALELAGDDPTYEDIASKFFEHFIAIADAMNSLGGTGLWDETDGFYYDQLLIGEQPVPLRTRSLVGLLPLIAAEVLEDDVIQRLPGFKKRMDWFLRYRPDLAQHIAYLEIGEDAVEPHTHRLLAIPSRDRLERVLRYLLDEDEFLSPYGIRSLSRHHERHPYSFGVDGETYRVDYQPAESTSGLFGGNSNWRGPIWFPVTYLLIEALERYHHFYGDVLTVECPTGSGRRVTLGEAASELENRLCRLFLPDDEGHRPCHGGLCRFAGDPHWRDLVLFYEYFHADTGRGCGASHQTGWTALVTECLRDRASRPATP